MDKYINENGKQCFFGATETTPFSEELFHEVTQKQTVTMYEAYDADIQFALHTDIGSITIVDRLTGFGWRDVETGYRSPTGDFWLASGNFDIREYACISLGEAIKKIKDNANTCKRKKNIMDKEKVIELATQPAPKREWVGLTDDLFQELVDKTGLQPLLSYPHS